MDGNGILFGAVWVGLFLFGWLYNWAVAALQASGRERGATAWLVVGGVLVTLAGAGLIVGFETTWVVLLLFGASGLPMIIGAWKRYTDERKAEEARRAEDERCAAEVAGEWLKVADE